MSPADKLTFGPPGAQWIYDRSTKTYDLTHGQEQQQQQQEQQPPPLRIALTHGPADTSILLSPAHTALVIVDMQNFFLHPSCRAHPTGLAAVDPLLATIAYCRAKGVQIVWLNWGLTDADLVAMPAGVARGFARRAITAANDDDDDEGVKAGLGVDLGEGKGRCLVAGEWNSQVYEPLAAVAEEEGDVWCAKNRMSGLWSEGQPLWKYLAGMGEDGGEGKEKRTLLFAGVNTDQCVLGTLTDAYNAGWDCVLVDDCCATGTPGAKEVCLHNVGYNYGFVINSKTVIAAT
ncbi:unnamed protein product [Discula destructiva]